MKKEMQLTKKKKTLTRLQTFSKKPKTATKKKPVGDFWADITAAEYARRQGVRHLKDISKLYGPGAAADWEGFDEALAQWRGEHQVA